MDAAQPGWAARDFLPPAQFSSTAQDLMAGKPTEIDHLNGFVVREGARVGVAAPVNRVLWTLVRMAGTGAGSPPTGTMPP